MGKVAKKKELADDWDSDVDEKRKKRKRKKDLEKIRSNALAKKYNTRTRAAAAKPVKTQLTRTLNEFAVRREEVEKIVHGISEDSSVQQKSHPPIACDKLLQEPDYKGFFQAGLRGVEKTRLSEKEFKEAVLKNDALKICRKAKDFINKNKQLDINRKENEKNKNFKQKPRTRPNFKKLVKDVSDSTTRSEDSSSENNDEVVGQVANTNDFDRLKNTALEKSHHLLENSELPCHSTSEYKNLINESESKNNCENFLPNFNPKYKSTPRESRCKRRLFDIDDINSTIKINYPVPKFNDNNEDDVIRFSSSPNVSPPENKIFFAKSKVANQISSKINQEELEEEIPERLEPSMIKFYLETCKIIADREFDDFLCELETDPLDAVISSLKLTYSTSIKASCTTSLLSNKPCLGEASDSDTIAEPDSAIARAVKNNMSLLKTTRFFSEEDIDNSSVAGGDTKDVSSGNISGDSLRKDCENYENFIDNALKRKRVPSSKNTLSGSEHFSEFQDNRTENDVNSVESNTRLEMMARYLNDEKDHKICEARTLKMASKGNFDQDENENNCYGHKHTKHVPTILRRNRSSMEVISREKLSVEANKSFVESSINLRLESTPNISDSIQKKVVEAPKCKHKFMNSKYNQPSRINNDSTFYEKLKKSGKYFPTPDHPKKEIFHPRNFQIRNDLENINKPKHAQFGKKENQIKEQRCNIEIYQQPQKKYLPQLSEPEISNDFDYMMNMQHQKIQQMNQNPEMPCYSQDHQNHHLAHSLSDNSVNCKSSQILGKNYNQMEYLASKLVKYGNVNNQIQYSGYANQNQQNYLEADKHCGNKNKFVRQVSFGEIQEKTNKLSLCNENSNNSWPNDDSNNGYPNQKSNMDHYYHQNRNNHLITSNLPAPMKNYSVTDNAMNIYQNDEGNCVQYLVSDDAPRLPNDFDSLSMAQNYSILPCDNSLNNSQLNQKYLSLEDAGNPLFDAYRVSQKYSASSCNNSCDYQPLSQNSICTELSQSSLGAPSYSSSSGNDYQKNYNKHLVINSVPSNVTYSELPSSVLNCSISSTLQNCSMLSSVTRPCENHPQSHSNMETSVINTVNSYQPNHSNTMHNVYQHQQFQNKFVSSGAHVSENYQHQHHYSSMGSAVNNYDNCHHNYGKQEPIGSNAQNMRGNELPLLQNYHMQHLGLSNINGNGNSCIRNKLQQFQVAPEKQYTHHNLQLKQENFGNNRNVIPTTTIMCQDIPMHHQSAIQQQCILKKQQAIQQNLSLHQQQMAANQQPALQHHVIVQQPACRQASKFFARGEDRHPQRRPIYQADDCNLQLRGKNLHNFNPNC